MKNKPDQFAYLWKDLNTGAMEYYYSLLALSKKRSIPYHRLYYRFGLCAMRILSLNEHEEVCKVPVCG